MKRRLRIWHSNILLLILGILSSTACLHHEKAGFNVVSVEESELKSRLFKEEKAELTTALAAGRSTNNDSANLSGPFYFLEIVKNAKVVRVKKTDSGEQVIETIPERKIKFKAQPLNAEQISVYAQRTTDNYFRGMFKCMRPLYPDVDDTFWQSFKKSYNQQVKDVLVQAVTRARQAEMNGNLPMEDAFGQGFDSENNTLGELCNYLVEDLAKAGFNPIPAYESGP